MCHKRGKIGEDVAVFTLPQVVHVYCAWSWWAGTEFKVTRAPLKKTKERKILQCTLNETE
jgi:hypothetical protein